MSGQAGVETVGVDPTVGLLERARALDPARLYLEGWGKELGSS